MKPVLLHIGATKTGTSSLQRFLAGNATRLAAQGVLYPQAGRQAGGQTAHHNLCYQMQTGRVATGAFKSELGQWSDALDELDGSSARTGVISSEAFMNCKRHQVPLFRDVLRGRSVTLIAYVRRQDRWLESAWNQQARFGRASLDFWDFYQRVAKRGRGDYAGMLEPWAEYFGQEAVSVRNFDSLPRAGIVPDFMRAYLPHVSVQETTGNRSDERRNTKAGVKQLVAVAEILALCRDRMGAEFELPSTSAVRIAAFFRDRATEVRDFSILTYEDACRLHEEFKGSNEQLKRLSSTFRESGGFPPPRPEEYENVRPLTGLGLEIFDKRESKFISRMAREIERAQGG